MLVTAVGPNSEWGMIMDKVQVEDQAETPLQEKLGAVSASALGACLQLFTQTQRDAGAVQRMMQRATCKLALHFLLSLLFSLDTENESAL